MTAAQDKTKNAPTTAPTDNDGWTTVIEEGAQLVKFDTVGDVFTGIFIGPEHIEPENQKVPKDDDDYISFDRWLFRDLDGVLVGINESYKLNQTMLTIPEGTLCRITYTKDIPSKKGNPMMDFKVETKKA